MRRLPSSWSDSLLARLGYRRLKKSRRPYQSRRSLFESLEMRAMLSGTQDEGIPLARPEYVIVSEIRADNQPSDQFVVHTEYATSGTPQAVVSLRDGITEIDDTLHTLQLELQLGSSVLERQEVLIDIESQAFRDQFLEDRLNRVSQEVTTPHRRDVAEWVEFLSPAGDFSDLATVDDAEAAETARERLEGIAKVVTSDVANLISTEELPNIYAALESQTEELIAAKAEVQSVDELRDVIDAGQSVGRAALLLADQLAEDLTSGDAAVHAAAEDLQSELAHSGEVYFTVFTGLGANQEVSREILEDGREKVLGFLEAGTYEISDHLRIDLGDQQAMVQATLGQGFSVPASLTTTLSPVADTYVYTGQPTEFGSDPVLVAGNGTGSPTAVSLLAIDLTNQLGKVPTQATLQLNTIWPVPVGSIQTVTPYTDTWRNTNTLLNERSFNDQAYASIVNNFVTAKSTTLTSTGGSSYAANITEIVQRALLLGDSNVDSTVSVSSIYGKGLGDVEAFYQAVRNWDAYERQYGSVRAAQVANELIYRNDANWDGKVDTGDIVQFFARLNTGRANYNLDNATSSSQSTSDGLDYSVWSQNYGRVATRFSQGDGNFDGYVNDLDLTIWQQAPKTTHAATTAPRVLLRIESTPGVGAVTFVSNDNGTLSSQRPKIDLTYPDAGAVITSFVGKGGSAGQMEVQYQVPYANATNLALQVYRVSTTDASEELIYANTSLNGAVTTGTSRLVPFNPTVINNPDENYGIVARLYIDGAQVSERELGGGVFKDDLSNNWHVLGSAGQNNVLLDPLSLSLSGDLTVTSGLTGSPINLYVHTCAGFDLLAINGDAINSGWVSGGDQNDTYDLSSWYLTHGANLRIKDDSGLDTLRLQNIDHDLVANTTLNLGTEGPQTVAQNGSFTFNVVLQDTPIEVGTGIDVSRIYGPGYQGTKIEVDTLADLPIGLGVPDDMGLRKAIAMAEAIPGSNTISFRPELFAGGAQTLTLQDIGGPNSARDTLVLKNQVTIEGPGADQLSISGNDQVRVLQVYAGATVTLTGLSIVSGRVTGGNYGAGILNDGNLTLDAVSVEKNVALNYWGGGIYSTTGDLKIQNSSFLDNKATYGGAIYYKGSQSGVGTSWIRNSTFSGNVATAGEGGAIRVGSEAPLLPITNATIANNTASTYGGGISIHNGSAGISVLLNNSIVADNTAGSTNLNNIYRSVISTSSYNLLGYGGNGGLTSGNHNILLASGEIAQLAPLGSNGGSTKTHALLPTSRAVDAGSEAVAVSVGPGMLSTDQRGYERFDDLSVAGAGIYDIGAFEYQGATKIVVDTADDENVAVGKTSLRQAILNALPHSIITFHRDLDGEEIRLGLEGDLIIRKSLVIDASDLPNGLTIRAYDVLEDHDGDENTPRIRVSNANGSRVFLIQGAETDVTLRGLTLTGGDAFDNGGAIRALGHSLTLEHVELSHNAVPRTAGYEILGNLGFIDADDPHNYEPICGEWVHGAVGGAIYSTGELIVRDSTFINNATYNFAEGTSALSEEQQFCRVQEGDEPEQIDGETPTQGAQIAGFEKGEVYAGDIYSLGDVTITGTTFKTVEVEALPTAPADFDDEIINVRLIDDGSNVLALGGVYITNRRIADAVVNIADTQFVETRGLVLDSAQVSDGRFFSPDETSGRIDYQIRNLTGGDLELTEPDNTKTTIPGGTLFAPTSVRAEKFASATFVRTFPDGSPPDDLSERAGFDIREVYGDGSLGAWVHVSLATLDDGTDLPDIPDFFTGEYGVIAVSEQYQGIAVELIDDALLAPGDEFAEFIPNMTGAGGAGTMRVHISVDGPTNVALSTLNHVISAINAEGSYKVAIVELTEDYDFSVTPTKITQSTPLAAVEDLNVFPRSENGVIATLTDVTMVDPRYGMHLRFREEWLEEDPDIPYELPQDVIDPDPVKWVTQPASIRMYNVTATIDRLTLYENPNSVVGVSAWDSTVTIDDSRFLPSVIPKKIDIALEVLSPGNSRATVQADASRLTISDSVFQDLTSDKGIVSVDVNSQVEIVHSTFLNNGAFGGVIAINPTFKFDLDEAGNHKVIPTRFAGELIIRDSLVAGNFTGLPGGAVHIAINTTVKDKCSTQDAEERTCDPLHPTYTRLAGNRVPYRLSIEGSTIQDNYAAYGVEGGHNTYAMGAGLSLSGPIDAFITGTTIARNRAGGDRQDDERNNGVPAGMHGMGGGIAAVELHSLRIENSTLSDNYAASAGGAIFAYDVDQIELTNVTITDNTAGEQGGGLFVIGGVLDDYSPESQSFAGVFIPKDDEVVTLINTIIAGNEALGLGVAQGVLQTHSDYPTYLRVTDGPGAFAVDYENTHDVWFARPYPAYFGLLDPPRTVFAASLANFHSLSSESSHNIIGVAPDETEDPNFPLFDALGQPTHSNQMGSSASRLDPGLAVLADYGGPSQTHAILLGRDAVDMPALDAGVELPLIKPRWIDSSSYVTDEQPAYNLMSEAISLTEGTEIPTSISALTGMNPDIDRLEWKTALGGTSGVLTFGFHTPQKIDRIVLWAGPSSTFSSTDPTEVEIAFSTDGVNFGATFNARITWDDSGDGASRVIRFDANDEFTPDIEYLSGSFVDNDGYVSAKVVKLTIEDSGVTLGEVRFGARPLQDQRGGVFDRVAGATIDIGAYESPVEYVLPTPQFIGGSNRDLVVSATADVIDRQLGTGNLSLREAIILANLYLGGQTIALPASLNPTQTITLTRGELRISDDTTIVATGMATGELFTIDASGSHSPLPSGAGIVSSGLPGPAGMYDDPFTHQPIVEPGTLSPLGSRIFNIDDGVDVASGHVPTTSVTLDGLALTGGLLLGSGAAIRSTENLTIEDSEIRGNHAYRNVRATSQYGYGFLSEYLIPSGGGIYSTQGNLAISGTTIADNSAVASGGGIHFADGHFEMSNSTVTSNVVRRPIVPLFDEFRIEDLSDSRATFHGGGVAIINASGTALIQNSTLNNNVALAADQEYLGYDDWGALITKPMLYAETLGGGLYVDSSHVLVSRSTISGNEAFLGGGIYVVGKYDIDLGQHEAKLELKQATVSGNIVAVHTLPPNSVSTKPNGGGIAVSGEADVDIRYSTITENRIDTTYRPDLPTGAGIYFPDAQGYVNNVDLGPSSRDNLGRMSIDHSIVAGNIAPTPFDPQGVPDYFFNYSTDAIGSSDIYFDRDGIRKLDSNGNYLDDTILDITYSLIGDNLGISRTWDPNSHYVDASGAYVGIRENSGYRQSQLVDPGTLTTPRAWASGGVPKPDAKGNLIGGPLMGEVYINHLTGNPTLTYYGGYLDPLLDALAFNGGATATHAPLETASIPPTLILPTITKYQGASPPVNDPVYDLVADPIVGFPFAPITSGSGTVTAQPQTLPYRGNEKVLQQRLHTNPTWQTSSAASGQDYFAQPGVEPPSIEFDLGGQAALEEFIVWASTQDSIYFSNDNYANYSEARSFKLEFFDGSDVLVAVKEFTRPDYVNPSYSGAPISPLAGTSHVFAFDAPVIATRVRVTITDNYFDGSARGGEYVTLGQVRFVGAWTPTAGPSPSVKSPAIDRGPESTSLSDQRGYPRTGLSDIGAHEAGAVPPGIFGFTIANVFSSLAETQGGGQAIKVADLNVANMRDAPLTISLVDNADSPGNAASVLEIRQDTLGRSQREIWVKPGVDVDFESFYNPVTHVAALVVDVSITDTGRGSTVTKTFTLPITDVNDRPVWHGNAPTISVPSDVTPETNQGIDVATLVARATDQDRDPTPDLLGIAIVATVLPAGTPGRLEYRYSNAGVWFEFPLLGINQAYLLPATAQVRFSPSGELAAPLASAFSFRVWDGSAGVAGSLVSRAAVEGALSSETLDVAVDVRPQLGRPFTANDGAPTTNRDQPAVAVDGRGVSIHVYREGTSALKIRRVGADGVLVGSPLTIASAAAGQNPQVVATNDGGAIIAWEESGGIYAQRYKLVGNALVADGDKKEIAAGAGLQLSSLTAIASDNSILATWEKHQTGFAVESFIKHTYFSAGSPTPSPVPLGTSGVDRTLPAAAVVDGVAGLARVAWLEGATNIRLGTYNLATNTLETHPTPAPQPTLTPPHVGGTSSGLAITRLQIARDGSGQAVVGWQETNSWSYPDDGEHREDETESRIYTWIARADGGTGWLETPILRASTVVGQTTGRGATLGDFSMAADSNGRIGLVWVEATPGVTGASDVVTMFLAPDGSVDRAAFPQLEAGTWTQARVAANAVGRFVLTARNVGAASSNLIVAQRYELASLSPNALTVVGSTIEVEGPDQAASRLTLASALYGTTPYLAVNGQITNVPMSAITTLTVRGNRGNDIIDLRELSGGVHVTVTADAGNDTILAGSGMLTVDGGTGDDVYVIANSLPATAPQVTIVDSSGNDTLRLNNWQGTRGALVVLGYAGPQVISQGGSPATVTLNLTTGQEIENIDEMNAAGNVVALGTRHLAFTPQSKPSTSGKPNEIVVTTKDDRLKAAAGGVSLREALLWAKTDPTTDVIRFEDTFFHENDSAEPLVVLVGNVNGEGIHAELVIDSSVEIRGVNKSHQTDADRLDRVILQGVDNCILRVAAGASATLDHLTLQNGNNLSGQGGAIYAEGNLTLNGVEISGSSALKGGGIAFAGGPTAEFKSYDSTIHNNQAKYGAGVAIVSGAAILDGNSIYANVSSAADGEGGGLWQAPSVNVQIVNSTFSGNEAKSGGGLFVDLTSGSLKLINVTDVLNQADNGGGLFVKAPAGVDNDAYRALAYNSIIAGNTIRGGTDPQDVGGSGGTDVKFKSTSVRNLIGSAATAGGLAHDPLGILGNHGNIVGLNGAGVIPVGNIVEPLSTGVDGFPRYHALAVSSPAIDKIDLLNDTYHDANAETPLIDQRGYIRGPDSPADPDDTFRDLGAYEFAGVLDTTVPTLPNIEDAWVYENALPGSAVPNAQLSAQPGWRSFVYDIVDGNFGGAFSIDRNTGVVRVADATQLDAERTPTYLLTVNATPTRNGDEVSSTVRIDVLDINERPQIQPVPSFTLSANALAGETVGSIVATDPEGDSLVYTLSNTGGALVIDARSGRITVADRTKLVAGSAITATVTATEATGEGLLDSQVIHVDVVAIASPTPKPLDSAAVVADFLVSHQKELTFNPVSGFANVSGDDYLVEYYDGSKKLTVEYSTQSGIKVPTASLRLTLGTLRVNADGSLKYDPDNDLVTKNRLRELGPDGRYYYGVEKVKFRITNRRTGETTEHASTIHITNSLPVFRSEYVALQNHRYTLDDTIYVERETSYRLDVNDLFVDPDGDPITVKKLASANAVEDNGEIREQFGRYTNGEPEFNSMWFERYVYIKKESSSTIDIYRDSDLLGANKTYDDAGFPSHFTFTIDITDGQVSGNSQVVVSQLEIFVAPSKRSSVAPVTSVPWLNMSKVPSEPAVLQPAMWSISAHDQQAGREGSNSQLVGDTVVDLVNGTFQRRHDLVLDGSGGASEIALPGLIYDSAIADPRPVIDVTLTPQALMSLTKANRDNTDVTARFTWYDHLTNPTSSPRPLISEVRYASLPNNNSPWEFRFQPPEAPQHSGVYHWEVEFEINLKNSPTGTTVEKLTLRQSGDTAVIVQKNATISQFGNGWSLEGVPLLVIDDVRPFATSSEIALADDRVILWFPGQTPRVFVPGAAGGAGGRQDYVAGEFTPIDLRTGLADPLEFGKLEFAERSDPTETTLPGPPKVKRDYIRYTAANGTIYSFLKISDTPAANAVNWRLTDITVPGANHVLKFLYPSPLDNPTSLLTLDKITSTDGKQIDFTTTSGDVTIKLSETGGFQVNLDLESNRLMSITHVINTPAVGTPDRVHFFTYEDTATGRLKEDAWGESTTLSSANRVTTFAYEIADKPGVKRLSKITYGTSGQIVYNITSLAQSQFDITTFTRVGGSNRWEKTIAGTPTVAGARTATVGLITNLDAPGDWLTEYSFDTSDNVLGVSEYFGTAIPANKLSSEQWTYDHLGSTTSYVDQLGRTTYYAYDYNPPTGSPTYKRNNLRGNVVRETTFAGVTQYEYETDERLGTAVGMLKRMVDPTGRESLYSRNKYGQLEKLQISNPTSTSAAKNSSEETWTYYDSGVNAGLLAGLLERHVDPLGLTTEYAYEVATRRLAVMTVTDRGPDKLAGGGDDQITRTDYIYDSNGYLGTATTHDTLTGPPLGTLLSTTTYVHDESGLLRTVVVKSATDAVLSKEAYEYDPDGRVKTVKTGDGDASLGDVSETTYEYDTRGLLTSETVKAVHAQEDDFPDYVTNYTYYTDGSLKERQAPDGTRTETVLDPKKRVQTTTIKNGAAKSTTYDGVTATVGVGDVVTKTTFDVRGRTLKEENNLTGAVATYRYDDLRHDAPTFISQRANLGAMRAAEAFTLTDGGHDGLNDDPATVLAYDQLGRVVYEKEPEQAARSYVFDELGYVKGVSVRAILGGDMEFLNDASGNVVEQKETRRSAALPAPTDDQKIRTEYLYDQQGRLRVVTDHADGPSEADVKKTKFDYVYEDLPDDFPIGIPDHGTVLKIKTTTRDGVTSTQWVDAVGQVICEKDLLGGITDNTYDARGNLAKTTFNPPVSELYEAIDNPTGLRKRIVTYTYDTLNRVRETIDHGESDADHGLPGSELTSRVDYLLPTSTDSDVDWDVISTDVTGKQTKTMYDALGLPVVVQYPDPTPSVLGDDAPFEVYSYDYAAQQLAYAVTTRVSTRDNVLSGAQTGSYDKTRVTRQVFSAAGDLLAEGARLTVTASDAAAPTGSGIVGAFFNDADHYEVRQFNTYAAPGRLASAGDGDQDFTFYSYDTQLTGTGQLAYEIGSNGELTLSQYDSAGNHLLQRQVNGEVDGAAAQNGELDNVTTWKYDDLSRVKEQTDVDPADPAAPRIQTWTYGNSPVPGNLQQTYTDADGYTTTTTLAPSTRTRTISVTGPGGYSRATVESLYSNGAVKSVEETLTIAGGQKSRSLQDFTYDQFGRLATVIQWSSMGVLGTGNYLTAPASKLSFTYHDSGLRDHVEWWVRTAPGDWGAMTPTQRAAASGQFVQATATTYGEDALQRLTTIEQTFLAAANSLWAAGARPADRSVKFSYNGDGARAVIQRYNAPTASGTSIADTTFGYDGSGRLKSLIHSHGVTELAATIISKYGAANRIIARETRRNVTGQAGRADLAVVRETYHYDLGGQINNVAVQTGATAAALDTTDTDSYNYDDSGNRVLDDAGAVDVGTDNRLAEDARFTYQYDRHGRLTERASRDGKVREIFAWDDRGLLLSVTRKEKPGADTYYDTQLVEYAYDADGRRTGRRVLKAATFGASLTVTEQSITQYDGTSRLAEFSATGKIVRHYLNGPGPNEVLAVDQSVAGSTATAWAFTDQLGSVTTWGSYNAATATWTLEHVAFDAFGNRDATLSSATPLTVGGQPLPQVWAGHQFESELDLYHMQARWYDPHSGRFLSPDPLSYAAGDGNLYRYVGNAVTTSTDPLGLYEQSTANNSAGNCNDFPRPSFTGPRCTGEWPKTPKTSHPLDWGAVREGIAEFATELWGPFEVVGGIAFEPFDWFVTAKEIYKDPRNLWNYAGLLPIIPGAIGRYGDEAAELTGQVRHEISRKVAKALDERPNLHAPSSGGGLVPTLQGNIPHADKWIRNGGRAIYHTDGSMTYIKNGVSIRYNSVGYPDFSKQLYKGTDGLNQVRIKLATQGSKATRYRLDFDAANAKAGFTNGTPEGYIWHHHEDTGLMQLVRRDVHEDFWHSGGMSLNK